MQNIEHDKFDAPRIASERLLQRLEARVSGFVGYDDFTIKPAGAELKRL